MTRVSRSACGCRLNQCAEGLGGGFGCLASGAGFTVNASHFQWGYMKLPVLLKDHRRSIRQCVLSCTLGLLASVVVIASPVMAVASQQGEQASEQSGPENQEQALERVRAIFPGTVISINQVRQDGRLRFRVRLDNEGNIYTVFVDQATGALSRE